jgi:DnaJ like chaperone protein
MGWWGKAVGGALGLLVGGPLGAMVGATVGHGFDRGTERVMELFSPARIAAQGAQQQELFLEATFSVMGHLAKSDGRVNETEIAFAESVMSRMELSRALRRASILFFNRGKSPLFDLNGTLESFRVTSNNQVPLRQLFLEIQLAAAYADGAPTPAERLILDQCRLVLQVSATSFRRLERLIQVRYRVLEGQTGGKTGGDQAGSKRRGERQPPPQAPVYTTLSGAYAVLGITPQASNDEVKRAYRKLMNRHHPDKLIARGLSEDAIQKAAQRTHEIRRAFETITRSRAPA